MGTQLFKDHLRSVYPLISAKLHEYLDVAGRKDYLDTYLYGILDEFIARGGKRVRPAMAMLASPSYELIQDSVEVGIKIVFPSGDVQVLMELGTYQRIDRAEVILESLCAHWLLILDITDPIAPVRRRRSMCARIPQALFKTPAQESDQTGG